VTLPGTAVWHMPFTTKADASDWKTYFEERNRLITALLHAPSRGGRRVVVGALRHQVRHLLSMQYASADLRLTGLEDLFAGPGSLHPGLSRRLREVKALRARYCDATVVDLPERTDTDEDAPPLPERLRGPLSAGRAARGVLRQLRPTAGTAQGPDRPVLPTAEATWWRLALLDGARVQTRDGRGARDYQRDRAVFLRLLRRTVLGHLRLLLQWRVLRGRYRGTWAEQTSVERWRRTLGSS
jgi:galactofuranosylgalactofuranosylrhamnosyl-N-acetylglucosaminyl-diphospho-decaprenol beta-1,5/1,6-galactofuranosyltransferase